jgi:hypothetical protein
MLEPVSDALWRAEGPTVSFLGIPYPTRMVVARLPEGGLWIWSPVALDGALRREVERLGEPRWIVEPNKLHHLALADWLAAWPRLRAWAPPGLADKRRDVAFEAELGDAPPEAWAGAIDQVLVVGSLAMSEVLFFHRPSRTCLVGDLVQKHDTKAMKAWQRWLMRLDGLAGPGGSTPREWRATFLGSGRRRARRAVERALAWRPERLVIAHGTCPPGDATAILRDSLAWLGPFDA